MWMLVTTLCLQLSKTDADCQREVRGPYPTRSECWGYENNQEGALRALADDIEAKVLFLSLHCQQGRDG